MEDDYDDLDLVVLDALSILRAAGVSLTQAHVYLVERANDLWDIADPVIVH